MSQPNSVAADLCSFIDASPSPFHVTETVASRLEAGGFRRLREVDAWPAAQGRYYVIRGGLAGGVEQRGRRGARLRRSASSAAHTDSPNLRVKQHPDLCRAGWQLVRRRALRRGPAQLLARPRPRPLRPRHGPRRRRHALAPRARGPAGAAGAAAGDPPRPRGRHDRAQAQPAAAPGRRLGRGDRAPSRSPGSSPASSGSRLPTSSGWELMTHDLTPSRVVGRDGDLVSAPRMDNQVTCFAGTTALLQEAAEPSGTVRVLALFDHEEVGSVSDRGAASTAAGDGARADRAGSGGAREDLHCVRWPARSSRPATWPTPRTPTTSRSTSRSTRSP